MKTFLSILMSMVLVKAVAMQPDIIFPGNCRTGYDTANPEVPVQRQIEVDLVSGQWSHGEELKVFFHEDGTSDWLTKSIDGFWSYEEKDWSVFETLAGPTLKLEAEGEFLLEPTCEGLNLHLPGELEPLQLEYAPANNKELMKQANASIIGDWEHVLSPGQLESLNIQSGDNLVYTQAKVRVHFGENGRFAKELICREADLVIRETGSWKISPDGRYLMLYAMDGGKSLCLQLKYLELDEMVLGQALAFVGQGESNFQQDFYFNKH